MIKTILVPATGNDMGIAVFRSALTVARPFAAHLEFLHVHVNATAMAGREDFRRRSWRWHHSHWTD